MLWEILKNGSRITDVDRFFSNFQVCNLVSVAVGGTPVAGAAQRPSSWEIASDKRLFFVFFVLFD
jgi:hypothetical protein